MPRSRSAARPRSGQALGERGERDRARVTVGVEPFVLLEGHHRREGRVRVVAVDLAGTEPEIPQPGLQQRDERSFAALPHRLLHGRRRWCRWCRGRGRRRRGRERRRGGGRHGRGRGVGRGRGARRRGAFGAGSIVAGGRAQQAQCAQRGRGRREETRACSPRAHPGTRLHRDNRTGSETDSCGSGRFGSVRAGDGTGLDDQTCASSQATTSAVTSSRLVSLNSSWRAPG